MKTFSTSISNADGEIVCPACGNGSLHHVAVDVWTCGQEDSENLSVVNIMASVGPGFFRDTASKPVVNELSIPRRALEVDDLSTPRRGAIEVHFYCECCYAKPVLRLWQHKGHTMAVLGA